MRKLPILLLAATVFFSLASSVKAQVCDMCSCLPDKNTQKDCPGTTCNPECWECLYADGHVEVDPDTGRYEHLYAWTVLGCLPTKPSSFVTWFLRFAMGIGGGVAFLFMVAGAFKVLTSGGDPNQLASGKKKITGAILGILVIVFAVIILRILGYDILQLPGFGARP